MRGELYTSASFQAYLHYSTPTAAGCYYHDAIEKNDH